MATKINIRTLLEAGCHFGHQTRRWNPKMKRVHLHRAQRHLHHRPQADHRRGIDPAYDFVKETVRPRRQRPVRRHQEAGSGGRGEQPPSASACPTSTSAGWAACSPTSCTIRSRINRMEELEAMVARRPHGPAAQEGAGRAGQGARQAAGQPRWRPRHEVPAAGPLRDRHQARGERHQGGPAPAHPGRRPHRHQLRSRRGRFTACPATTTPSPRSSS